MESERPMSARNASIRPAVIAFAASLLAGCAASPSRVDPFEPMNRGLYQVHDAVDTAIMKPAIQMYIDVVPEPIRQAVSNVFNNVDDMISVVNDLLQGKLDKFGNDMGRVMLNTVWGVGGMFDLASMVGIERGNEDFGQTFGVWGFDQGPYLFVPIFGPTTFRDGAGWIARIAVGPVGYIPDVPVRNVLYGAGAVDLRAQAVGTSQLVDTAAIDRYLFIRNAYLQRRRYLVYDGKPPPEPEEE
jgi:phospholipid-binding lipoprotein MlaA